jgi:hypothetical protein
MVGLSRTRPVDVLLLLLRPTSPGIYPHPAKMVISAALPPLPDTRKIVPRNTTL